MKVRNVIKKLLEYNQDAEFGIVINGDVVPFDVTFFSDDGGEEKEGCEAVYFDTGNYEK